MEKETLRDGGTNLKSTSRWTSGATMRELLSSSFHYSVGTRMYLVGLPERENMTYAAGIEALW